MRKMTSHNAMIRSQTLSSTVVASTCRKDKNKEQIKMKIKWKVESEKELVFVYGPRSLRVNHLPEPMQSRQSNRAIRQPQMNKAAIIIRLLSLAYMIAQQKNSKQTSEKCKRSQTYIAWSCSKAAFNRPRSPLSSHMNFTLLPFTFGNEKIDRRLIK